MSYCDAGRLHFSIEEVTVPPSTGQSMQFRYYDQTLGRERIKRRYKYAAYAFTGGLVLGYILGHLF